MPGVLVDIFSDLFQSLQFARYSAAAEYYVAIIKNRYPSTIKLFCTQTRTSYQVLVEARYELLKEGFIAKVIKDDPEKLIKSDDKESISRKGEFYLPANPKLVWEGYKERLTRLTPENIKNFDEEINNFEINHYKRNFGEFGIGLEKDSDIGHVSLQYTSEWFFNIVVNNLKSKQHISMLLGGLGSFEKRYLPYYAKMLNTEESDRIHLNILYNYPIKPKLGIGNYTQANENYKKELEKQRNSLDLINERLNFPENIELRIKVVPHATTRRIIVNSEGKGYYAIDATKILELRKEQQTTHREKIEPFYRSTIYLHEEDIAWLNDSFAESWENSIKGDIDGSN